ncbi:MAG: hypothetical protein IPI32_01190 [Austwickia sp.]|nr:hypothetical protein [Austwickia sp.]MBK8437575.1 hypothetical protein [Austwickia sp.]MBK9102840.1 hypothetical protein [Austwickia sp.]
MCDTLVSITPDGLMFAKNSDRDPNEPQVLRWYPSVEHAPESTVKATWSRLPQVSRTRSVLLSQPWWMWGAEMGANDAGLVIGNEAVFTRNIVGAHAGGHDSPDGSPSSGPRHEVELLGMDLLRLTLERAGTAHEAVGVLTGLLERYGQGGPCSAERPSLRYDNSFLIADPEGAYVVETAGRQWAALEVRGPGYAISNGLTIPGFAQRYADPVRGRVTRCQLRRRRTTAAAQHVATSATPVSDLFAALRDHGDGPAPRYSGLTGAFGGACAHAGGRLVATQTTASWVADLRGGSPGDVGRHWATGTAAPCLSLFRPVVFGPAPAVEPAHGTLANRYDHGSLWWRHERLHRLATADYPAALGRFGNQRDRMESAWLNESAANAAPAASSSAGPTSPMWAALAAAAVSDADAAYQRWADDLIGAALHDRRPAALRRRWQHWDLAALA